MNSDGDAVSRQRLFHGRQAVDAPWQYDEHGQMAAGVWHFQELHAVVCGIRELLHLMHHGS
jgi:hypothetical protein